jgi:hypothetical protein
MIESHARRVILVHAFDEADSPLWSREDGQWASRLAVQSLREDAQPAALLVVRAEHALERLAPRDPAIGAWLRRTGWRWRLLGLALAAGLAAGLLADLVGPDRHVSLLAPAFWGVLLWNLAIYVVLMLSSLRHGPALPGWFRRLLAGWWERAPRQGPLQAASARWLALSSGLQAQRTAVLVHVAAAALGAGMVAGLYLRGLVFDFRAAWQSTFLDAATLHAVLSLLLAPASAVTGVALPDVQALADMRLTPDQPLATVSAAPWIHLFAATMAGVVVLPRLLLAAWAFSRATVLALRLPLPVQADYLLRFARWHRSGTPRVQVMPYAQLPSAQAALGLRELLAHELGDDVTLKMGDVTAIGDEGAATARAGGAGAVLRVALVDLGATPEDDHQGRFLRALADAQPPAPTLLLLDEAAFRRRFGSLPGRLDERRRAWRSFAEQGPWRVAVVNLDRPDDADALTSLQQALRG